MIYFRLSPLSYRQQEEKLSKLQSQLEDAKQLRELSNKRRINLTKMISGILKTVTVRIHLN